MQVPMLDGSKVTVSLSGGGVKIGSASVETADLQCNNGVIHVIDKVLLPSADAVESGASVEWKLYDYYEVKGREGMNSGETSAADASDGFPVVIVVFIAVAAFLGIALGVCVTLLLQRASRKSTPDSSTVYLPSHEETLEGGGHVRGVVVGQPVTNDVDMDSKPGTGTVYKGAPSEKGVLMDS
eukprot:TRINITY_DN4617_c0_g1_i2.p1 TRINITY_DN4617_c0_g1~~TRINITY_DN4617_c0_g1_i2.p1  ORF type:complete len:183 (-),score=35.14 TRINITY_DN4617_c0_g1_i2:50-598(-)